MLGKIEAWSKARKAKIWTASCPTGMVAKQIRCAYDYCRQVHIGCAKPASRKIVVVDSDRLHSNEFSQHWPFKNIGSCPDGYYVRKITCFEITCSYLFLGCVRMVFVE